MNKSDLVNAVSKETGHTKKDVHKIITATLANVRKTILKDERVTLERIGTFALKSRSSRTGFNPQTRQYELRPSKTILHFEASDKLKIDIAETYTIEENKNSA